MACGTPVAAFPVTGPIDVVEPGVSGVLDADLRAAALAALALPRDGSPCPRARRRGDARRRSSWKTCTRFMPEAELHESPHK